MSAAPKFKKLLCPVENTEKVIKKKRIAIIIDNRIGDQRSLDCPTDYQKIPGPSGVGYEIGSGA
jgi:hypothetical protein